MKTRWEGFKNRKPNGFYSYVWWETIIMFLLPIGLLITFILALVSNIWFAVPSIIFWMMDIYWSRRELRGRKQYYDKVSIYGE